LPEPVFGVPMAPAPPPDHVGARGACGALYRLEEGERDDDAMVCQDDRRFTRGRTPSDTCVGGPRPAGDRVRPQPLRSRL